MSELIEHQPAVNPGEGSSQWPFKVCRIGEGEQTILGWEEAQLPVVLTTNQLIESMRKRLAVLEAPQDGDAFREQNHHGRK